MTENNTQQHPPELFAVIMAGGVGSRLWPLSRKQKPKQFLDFLGDGSMIGKTIERLKGLVPIENIMVVTNQTGAELTQECVPELNPCNIIVEPAGKNTAPCIALATAYIKKRNPNSTTIVLPADHLILNTERFQETLKASVEIANRSFALVTLGIKPTRPETGYGYIQADEKKNELLNTIESMFDVKAHKVKTFAEKPDQETALTFLKSGGFLWNSGVFIWHNSSISREFEQNMPELYKDMTAIEEVIGSSDEKETIEKIYTWTHSISIDYGIMEKADPVFVIESTFDWSDLGSWDEVAKLREQEHSDDKKHEEGMLQKVDADHTIVMKPDNKAVAIIGADDLIVVDTKDALLICKRGESQKVKAVVDTLKRKQHDDYI